MASAFLMSSNTSLIMSATAAISGTALPIVATSVGDEGGFAPNLPSNESALELLGPAQLRRICVVAATARNAGHSLADIRGLEPMLRRHCQASAGCDSENSTPSLRQFLRNVAARV